MATMKSNGFLMFNDWKPLIDSLNDDQVGDIVKGIYAVVNGEEYAFREDTKALAAFFLTSIMKNINKYEETCRRKSESAKRRANNSNTFENIPNNSNVEDNTRTRTRIIQEQEQEKYKNKNKSDGTIRNPFAELLEEGLV